MEPVQVDINTATARQLYAECVRLQLRQDGGMSPQQLRIQLRLYARRQKTYAYELRKWTFAAEQLGLQVTDGMEPRKIELLTYNHLYERLVTEGYVSRDRTGKPLRDPTDDTLFYVTGRLSAETVSVECLPTCKPQLHEDHGDSCAVWHAASLVFADVARASYARMEWEEDHKAEKGDA